MALDANILDADENIIDELWTLVARQPAEKGRVTDPCTSDTGDVNLRDQSFEENDECDQSEEHYENEEEELLLGKDNDPLIPSPAQIDLIWNQGRATWFSLAAAAKRLPPGRWPAGISDPSIMLRDVPALPQRIPRRGLSGQPVWHVPNLDRDTKEIYGAKKQFHLSFTDPVRCRISSQTDDYHDNRNYTPCKAESYAPRGLAILTFLWSYVLSVRLWELQGREARYSQHALRPNTLYNGPQEMVLYLPQAASPGLVRWLCGVLAPKPGWMTDRENDFPPWAALCSGDVQFAVFTSAPVELGEEQAPTSSKAREFLIEFCCLYGCGPGHRDETSESMPPYTAAFLAALSIPFYRTYGLQPRFPVPSLESGSASGVLDHIHRSIQQYYDDILYYMTLSMDPISLGSMIWSIFWQPEIECNLVSPWLGSILSVIQPILQLKDLYQLVKIFVCRRPRIALMWLGIFLLGDVAILDRVERYLQMLEERPFHGSIASPDIVMTAWTGSLQSFWDEDEPYLSEGSTVVPRANILRRRHNFRLQDDRYILFSWRPFGHVSTKEIEPELLEYLERPYFRRYMYWVWLVDGETRNQHGFRRDTSRCVDNISDNLELLASAESTEAPAIKLAASKRATLSMLHHSVQDVLNERSLEIASIPNLTEDHEWLKDWRGLECR